ncbi:response regulator [Aquimarina sp. 2201CG1-2-11]|uniref:hybrid sensor histidine kinase/response regulator transcription factor n=1 Tax=Aquimarina discodermiae TaxID=3231043 RepID=UPI003463069F
MKISSFYIVGFLFFLSHIGIGQNAHFNNINREDGLASNFIRVIYQDSYGYMWFGTDNGLNRYDGIEMDTYRHNSDIHSLTHNYVKDILQTNNGKLLICTSNNVDVFNYKTEKFESINFIGDFNYKGMVETPKNEVWVLSNNNIINVLNKDLQIVDYVNLKELEEWKKLPKNNINLFKYDKNNIVLHIKGQGFYLLNITSKKISFLCDDLLPKSTIISKIVPISTSEFWVLTHSGAFTITNGQLSNKYTAGDTKNGDHLTSNFILDFKVMPNNEFWLFTDGGGINIYNTITKKFRYILNDLNNTYSLASNFIFTAYVDKNSSLWLGTIKNGVSQLDADNPFSTYKLISTENNQKFNIPISSLFLDSRNRIWVGCDGKGLYRFENNILQPIIYDKTIKTITSINQISSNTLILGTYKNGISTYNTVENRLTKQKYLDDELNLDTKITFIEKDKGAFWIGGSKVLKLNVANKGTLLKPDMHFSSNNIRALSFKATPKATPLFGTLYGLYSYTGKKFEEISNQPKKTNSIYKHKENEYWLATNNGLNLINIRTKENVLFGSESGLNNDEIRSLLAYDKKNIWLGTGQGVSKFNLETQKYVNFTYKDGFLDNSFNALKSLKLNDGRLVFGGVKGLLIFHPDSIKIKTKTNKALFTKLLINHKRVSSVQNQILAGKSIEEAKLITLDHTQKVITLNFSSFNYNYTDNISFSYKLEGYNNDWSITKDKSLTFMNLAPGTYNLKIKASSLSGLWDESYTNVKIKVLPAWWQTTWFKLFIACLVIFITYLINRAILNRERLKRNFEFEKKSLEDQKELDEQQLRFFTNLSHEIRTPLSLILSPLEAIIGQTKNVTINNNLSLIQKNALRINRLINRGIDFRETQFKEPNIQVEYADIIIFLKELAGSFSDYSMSKNIKLQFNSNIDSLFLWFDKYMVETIFYNLLSNAFKYSIPHSKIILEINKLNEHVIIKVQDFGQGISVEDLPNIFKRFYQSKAHKGGSGIGLALTKKFVDAHKGNITVKNTSDKGSIFEVTFLLGNDHFEKSDLLEVNKDYKSNTLKKETLDTEIIFDPKLKNKNILIVEDEDNLRDYLLESLSKTYTSTAVENGLDAIEIIHNQKIDLVVTDVAMPFIDGIELCKILKENLKTCDIPIILLTAKTLNQEKIKGYETGADAYLEKPFSLNVLKSRINNLLQKRNRVTNKMADVLKISIDPETINTSDQKFYEECIAIIEKHIDDVDFNITKFSKELGMSKSLIYNKMSKITDVSINGLIQIIRLNKAAQMLIHTKKPITEISLLVGFQNAKYFSTSFKKKFGVTPSKYRTEKVVD